MKIIHCADLHLASKIDKKSEKVSEERKSAVRTTFSKLVEFAKENGVEVILLSGDVFDSNKPTKKDKDFFYSTVASTPEIDFLYLKGNHDQYEVAGEEIKNLKTFTDKWTSYDYGNISFTGIEMTKDNCERYYQTLSLDKDKINIVLLHGQVSSTVGYEQIKISNLANKYIDYLALGHIHSYSDGVIDQRGKYAYSGCIEGRGFDEVGPKGFVFLDVADKVEYKFVEFASRTIKEIDVDITGAVSIPEVIRKVKEALGTDTKNIYRINLVGEVSYNVVITDDDILSYFNNYYYIDIKNKVKTAIDISKYQNDLSLRGEFIRKVSSDVSLSEEEKNEIISLGLRVLQGSEVEL